jgi:hypothetical protein
MQKNILLAALIFGWLQSSRAPGKHLKVGDTMPVFSLHSALSPMPRHMKKKHCSLLSVWGSRSAERSFYAYIQECKDPGQNG